MTRINLLPYREERRRLKQRQFYTISGVTCMAACVLAFLTHSILVNYVHRQETRNSFLKEEIVNLDKDIGEIKRLKEQTEALLSRKRVIESLQLNRAEAVRLFNELARCVPSGVYLKSLKQTGQKIHLLGYVQSDARVATLMRNLDASPLLENPNLIEIKATTIGNRPLSEFSLNVSLTRILLEQGVPSKK